MCRMYLPNVGIANTTIHSRPSAWFNLIPWCWPSIVFIVWYYVQLLCTVMYILVPIHVTFIFSNTLLQHSRFYLVAVKSLFDVYSVNKSLLKNNYHAHMKWEKVWKSKTNGNLQTPTLIAMWNWIDIKSQHIEYWFNRKLSFELTVIGTNYLYYH